MPPANKLSAAVLSGAAVFAGMRGCTPGYLNVEGAVDQITDPEQQMKMAKMGLWPKGFLDFYNVLEQWRNDGGLKGLEVAAVE